MPETTMNTVNIKLITYHGATEKERGEKRLAGRAHLKAGKRD